MIYSSDAVIAYNPLVIKALSSYVIMLNGPTGMSAEERADLDAMHANEKRLYDQLDSLDEELLKSRDKAAQAEADKQSLLDEFETLQTQVPVYSI